MTSTAMKSGMAWPASTVINAPGVNGVARFTTDTTGVRINPVTVIGAYRAVEADAGCDVTDLKIDGLTASDLQRDGIRLRNAFDTEISRFDLRFREAPQTGEHLPQGIAITGGRNITIRDGLVDGFRLESKPGVYTNGDGIATEGGVDGLAVERVIARNCADGGFDLKGTNIRVDALTAEANSRNFRFWHQAEAGEILSINPRSSAVWLGKGAVVRIRKLIARSDRPTSVFALEGSTVLIVDEIDVSGMAPGSVLIKSNGSGNKVTLPVGTPKTF